MKTKAFLKIGKWVIVFLQFIAIMIPLLFLASSYRTDAEGMYNTPLGFSNLALVPEDDRSIEKLDNVSITFRESEQVKAELTIEKTKINIENGISYVRFKVFFVFLLFSAMAALGLELLKRIIKAADSGNPFVQGNVRNIFAIATLFFISPIVQSIYHYYFGKWILSNFELSGLVLSDHSISYFPWIVTSILLLAIGKVMEEGIKIREEQDLTI